MDVISVDYNIIDSNDILIIHKYLIQKSHCKTF